MAARLIKPHLTKPRLTKLRVECFRGATNRVELQFNPAKPLVILFGENGTGKSTLVDALDLIANQRIGSLRERSSASATKHAPAIGKKCQDIKVTLCRGEDRWEGTYNGSKVTVLPAKNGPFPAKNRRDCKERRAEEQNGPRIEILRRSQLLKLVEAQPGKRYEVLQQFLDVGGVEESERTLKQATDAAKDERTAVIQAKQAAEEQLSALWQNNGQHGAFAPQPYALCNRNDLLLTWAASKAKLDTATLDLCIRDLNELIAAIQSCNTRLADYKLAVAGRTRAEAAQTELHASQGSASQRSGAQQAPSQQASQLISVLEATAHLLEAGWQESACPVCKQGMPVAELRARVADALASMQSLKTLHDQEQAINAAVANTKKAADTEREKLLKAVLLLVAKSQEVAQVVNCPEIVGLSLDFSHLMELLKTASVIPADFHVLMGVTKILLTLEQPLCARRDDLQQDKNQLHTIQSQYKIYTDSAEAIALIDALCKQLESAHAIVHGQRIAFIQQILDSVSQEAARLYDAIHPGEDTRPSRLELDPAKRGSLLQFAEFAGLKNIEPQESVA